MKYSIEQPQPFDPNYTRYYPIRKFPSYQHIPGVTPHSFNDKTGHNYGLHVEVDAQVPPPEAWRENSTYLYGIDLYNSLIGGKPVKYGRDYGARLRGVTTSSYRV
jgi:hypothetical protein